MSEPTGSGERASPLALVSEPTGSLPPLLPVPPLRFPSFLLHTRALKGIGWIESSSSFISYLVTVWSLTQSHHPLQGLGRHLLPLVQKFPLPITELKTKAQVQVPRAASERVDECGDNLESVYILGSLTDNTPGDLRGWEVIPSGLDQMGRKAEPTEVFPTSSQAPSTSNLISPHVCLHPQSHLLALKERDSK